MKMFRMLGAALLALFAFGVLTAASASAVPTFLLALWLVNGAEATELATTTTGELLLEDTKTTIGVVAVKCSGILDGWIGPNSLDYVSEVLSLTGGAISSTALTGTALECAEETGSCPSPLVWPVNLPWETEVELMEDSGTFFADLLLPRAPATEVGWEVECMGIVPLTDTCTQTEGVTELELEAGTTLLGKFSLAFTELAGAKLAKCTQSGGQETGVVEGEGPTVLVGGGSLTASSETSEA
jgi:hypothetical protein